MKINDVNEYWQLCKEIGEINDMFHDGYYNGLYMPAVICEDGFRINIQCGSALYSVPRENRQEKYEAFELGYPNTLDPMLEEYQEYEEPEESEDGLYMTIYPYVPTELVNKLIDAHGGIVGFEKKKRR